ncbi:RICIN domain-containing protein [Catellatospora sp. KI3]|uniref:RICIN domain-containing protein n=1 Tax=Catellatospora sp. KI3 TaxID=3041620 RepID=UPI0024821492|nr:RICIN domain-containing protein [Catellatospora sp. KI3]MDI1462199.1 RICIN domain-containing protein [Catellatospora sp. KI3]
MRTSAPRPSATIRPPGRLGALALGLCASLILGAAAAATVGGPAEAAGTGVVALAAPVVQRPVPQAVVNRFQLDTRWYAKYVAGPVDPATGIAVPILGSAAIEDATLLKAARQAATLVRTYPTGAVAELNRRNVRIVMIARSERMSSIPEVFRDAGTSWDERYWAGMGGPLTVGTEANLIDNQGGENVFIHEFGHTVDGWSLRYADPRFGPDLDGAYQRARSMGLWNNTYAGSNVGEYWAEGVQSYFDLNRQGPVGGDGVHNDVNTRAELARYDTALFALLDRVYRGTVLEPADPVGQMIIGTGSNRCVDVSGGRFEDGTKIQLWDCHGGPEVRWTWRGQQLVNSRTGKCLDIAGNATAEGTRVQQWTCNTAGGQLWQFVNGNLRNPQSGKCLDADAWGTANGTQLIIWFCGSNQSNQTWRFQ